MARRDSRALGVAGGLLYGPMKAPLRYGVMESEEREAQGTRQRSRYFFRHVTSPPAERSPSTGAGYVRSGTRVPLCTVLGQLLLLLVLLGLVQLLIIPILEVTVGHGLPASSSIGKLIRAILAAFLITGGLQRAVSLAVALTTAFITAQALERKVYHAFFVIFAVTFVGLELLLSTVLEDQGEEECSTGEKRQSPSWIFTPFSLRLRPK